MAKRRSIGVIINGLGGDDVINATGVAVGQMKLTLNGGLGADVILGGAGDDLINGGDGNDIALMGGGNDTFVWNPGDDNDTLEGQGGTDTMLFNGANIAENIDILANGGRALFLRNVANVTMDLNDVETINFNALGGARYRHGERSVRHRRQDGRDQPGEVPSGAPPETASWTPSSLMQQTGMMSIKITGSGGAIAVNGLAAQVTVGGAESTDSLIINALGGNNAIDASGLSTSMIKLTINGGAGVDVIRANDPGCHSKRRCRQRCDCGRKGAPI